MALPTPWFWTSKLQNCEINFCCLQTSSLWRFVTMVQMDWDGAGPSVCLSNRLRVKLTPLVQGPCLRIAGRRRALDDWPPGGTPFPTALTPPGQARGSLLLGSECRKVSCLLGDITSVQFARNKDRIWSFLTRTSLQLSYLVFAEYVSYRSFKYFKTVN